MQGCLPNAPKACEGVMITTDALKYLPQMGLDPSRVVGCAGAQCQKSFTLANGFAVEAVVAEKLSIAFFCSASCYLNEIHDVRAALGKYGTALNRVVLFLDSAGGRVAGPLPNLGPRRFSLVASSICTYDR